MCSLKSTVRTITLVMVGSNDNITAFQITGYVNGMYTLVEVMPDEPRWVTLQATDMFSCSVVKYFKVGPLLKQISEQKGKLPFPNEVFGLESEKIDKRLKLFVFLNVFAIIGFSIIGFVDCTAQITCRSGGDPMDDGPNAKRWSPFIQLAFYNGCISFMV
jgi:hypothetical protein